VQAYNELATGPVKQTYATIDLNPYVDVHQFFSLRIEFSGILGSTAIFVNDQKIFARNLGDTYTRNGGRCGFVYESQSIGNSFEVERLYVKPSIWESIGNFQKYQPE
jgi:hypothetical protein